MRQMEQKSLTYCFVARGTEVLAEYAVFSGSFKTAAQQRLHELRPHTNDKLTYTRDQYKYHYWIEEGFTYLVVAEEKMGRLLPFAFLERVKENFKREYGGRKAHTADAHSLDKKFGRKMKELMQYCVDHPEEMNNLLKMKKELSAKWKEILLFIEKVVDRGEDLKLAFDKAMNLGFEANNFRRQGKQLRWNMWYERRMVILFMIIAAALAFIILRRHIFSATYVYIYAPSAPQPEASDRQMLSATCAPPAPESEASDRQMFSASCAPPVLEPEANEPCVTADNSPESSRLMQVIHGEVTAMPTDDMLALIRLQSTPALATLIQEEIAAEIRLLATLVKPDADLLLSHNPRLATLIALRHRLRAELIHRTPFGSSFLPTFSPPTTAVLLDPLIPGQRSLWRPGKLWQQASPILPRSPSNTQLAAFLGSMSRTALHHFINRLERLLAPKRFWLAFSLPVYDPTYILLILNEYHEVEQLLHFARQFQGQPSLLGDAHHDDMTPDCPAAAPPCEVSGTCDSVLSVQECLSPLAPGMQPLVRAFFACQAVLSSYDECLHRWMAFLNHARFCAALAPSRYG